jgi:hypothetical protein
VVRHATTTHRVLDVVPEVEITGGERGRRIFEASVHYLPTAWLETHGRRSDSFSLPANGLIRPSDLHFGPPGTTSALEAFRVAQLERRMSEMPKDAHNKAAEHHENAAKSHKTAAEHHGKGDHAKGREESAKAHAHSKTAHEHSEMAHGKSQSQK